MELKSPNKGGFFCTRIVEELAALKMTKDDYLFLWVFIKRLLWISFMSVILIVIITLLDRNGLSYLDGLLMYGALEFYFYWRTRIVANTIR